MHVTPLLASEGGLADLFNALGVDWKSLVLNGLAFLVIVWLLGKYVYPVLLKALDNKLAEMETTTRLKQEAEKHLTEAQDAAAKLLNEARESAQDIVATAKSEAKDIMKESEQKAAAQAERIAHEAREQIGRDTEAARRALRAETISLVAQATEAILGEKLDGDKDAQLIASSIGGKR
jgi:F-type H+-transporting ATPase subunit b